MSTENPLDALDLSDVLAEEARQLRSRAFASARMVVGVIIVGAILLVALGQYADAMIWIGLAGAMVAVTLVYAYVIWPDGIGDEQVRAYLRGHVIVSACTGLVWGGFAIYQAQSGREAQIFTAAIFLSSITTGGAMSGTVYRPGYLALATASLIPFGAWLTVSGEGHLKIFGLFVLLYYAFCYITNEQASARTRRAILSDIGQAAAREIIEKSATIERLNAEKQRLTRAISHDMTQPIIAQQHLLTALERDEKLRDHAETLSGIREALNSQKQLLDELHSYSQFNSAPVGRSIGPVSVNTIIESLLREFSAMAENRGVVINTRVEVDSAILSGKALQRILSNLLSNAIKYADPAGTVGISVVPDPVADWIHFRVSNDGPGIPKAQQELIFDEYTRLSGDLDKPGLGLGLTITRNLVKELGGEITLSSCPGLTEFRVSLPAQADDPVISPEPAPFVLMVGQCEDPHLGSYSEMFSNWMWRCAHADTPQNAARLLRLMGASPDAIIFDPADDLNRDQPSPEAQNDTLLQSLGAPVLTIARADLPNAPDPVIKAPFSSQHLRTAIEALLT